MTTPAWRRDEVAVALALALVLWLLTIVPLVYVIASMCCSRGCG